MPTDETGVGQEQSARNAAPEHDHHRHLPMVQPAQAASKPAWDRGRWPVLGLAVAAVGCFAASFFQPWWSFKLYAPQYPKGLSLVISLTGMGGDVHEIDILNHYIGMGHLADAAPIERRLAGYGVAAVAVLTLAALTVFGKKLNKLVALPAIAFPLGFLGDSFYWLYSFGHNLNPKAPLHIAAFTPQLFGNGQIGQFETYAAPAAGFWLAVVGVACAIVGSLIRSKVCASCNNAGTCSTTCSRLMVLPERKAPT